MVLMLFFFCVVTLRSDESAYRKLFDLGRPDFISLSQQSANESDSSEMVRIGGCRFCYIHYCSYS